HDMSRGDRRISSGAFTGDSSITRWQVPVAWQGHGNGCALVGAEFRRALEGLTEESYRRLVEQSPDGICVHKDGRVLFVNDAGVRLMLADSPERLVGRSITDFV